MSDKVSITLLPEDKVIEVEKDLPLMWQLEQQGIYIKSSCGGHGRCGDCVVKVTDGADNLSAFSTPEKNLLGNVFHITKERLTCQTRCSGPIKLDISNHEKAKEERDRQRKFGANKVRVRKKETIRKEESENQAPAENSNEKPKRKHDFSRKRDESRNFKEIPKKGGLKRPKKFET